MLFLRRNLNLFVCRSNFRNCSDRSEPDFWKIVRKQWRKPRFPAPKEDSLHQKFAVSPATTRLAHKIDIFKPRRRRTSTRDLSEEQEGLDTIVKEESEQRGPIATIAQYLVFNGAKVRFSSFPGWIDSEENSDKIPGTSEVGSVLVGLDISYTELDYVGIRVVKDLHSVTTFSAEGCKLFDDYCLDYISAYLPALEELNLSFCPLITSRGLGALYRFRKLRTLNLNGIMSDAELELICVMLEEHFPNLTIEGVTYMALKQDKNK